MVLPLILPKSGLDLGFQVAHSCLFNRADSADLSKTFGSAGNRKTFTISAWVRRAMSASDDVTIISANNDDRIRFNFPADGILIRLSATNVKTTTEVFRDPTSWYHLVLKVDTTQPMAADRVRLYVNGVEINLSGASYPAQNADTQFCNAVIHRVGSIASQYYDGYQSQVALIDGQALGPESFGEVDKRGVWRPIDLSGLSFGTNGFLLDFGGGTDALVPGGSITATAPLGGTANNAKDNNAATTLTTTSTPGVGQVLVHYDLGSAETIRRVQVVDYSQNHSFGVSWRAEWSTDDANWNTYGSSVVVSPGNVAATDDVFDGAATARYWRLLAHQNHDTAVTLGDFLLYTDFAAIGNLGRDASGNGNDFTATNLAAADQIEDTPTTVFSTFSSIAKGTFATPTISEAGLQSSVDNTYLCGLPAIPGTGKWYWELQVSTSPNHYFGLASQDLFKHNGASMWAIANQGYFFWYVSASNTQRNDNAGGFTVYDSGLGQTVGTSILGVAVDADAKKIWVHVDGTWANTDNPSTATGGFSYSIGGGGAVLYPCIAHGTGVGNTLFNFGQRPIGSGGYADDNGQGDFDHDVPDGFLALCSKNLPELTDSTDPKADFETLLYTGTGAVRSIAGLDFQPDLVWIKNRDAADEHKLVDSARGATKELSSNNIDAEATDANGLTAFNADGFSLGTGANGYNDNTEDFVAWCWREGLIFDVQTYTGNGVAGRTVTHQLGATPRMIIVKKSNSGSSDWVVYHAGSHASVPETQALFLASISGALTDTHWNDTAPSSTQVTLGTKGTVNANGDDYVMYLFADVPGICQAGHYIGNGSADGPVVYTGFRPRFLLRKRADGAGNWYLQDSARESFNDGVSTPYVNADLTAAEASGTGYIVDFLSSGFKVRTSTADVNASGGRFIYLAVAEFPVGGVNVSPGPAR